MFEVDLHSGELRKAGVRVSLQDQPLRVLVALLERPGDLITREELRRQLWPDDTFVDFDHGLNAAIKRLRDALGDSAQNPRFVETLPRRGYRFIAPVASVPMANDSTREVAPAEASARSRRVGWPVIGAAVVLGVVIIAVAAAALWWPGRVPRASDAGAAAPAPHDAESSVAAVPGNRGSNLVGVIVFENHTADPTLDPFGRLVADRLIRAIAQVATVEVVPAPIDSPNVTSSGGAVRVAGRSDARIPALLIAGAYYRQGARFEVQARVVDAVGGRLLHPVAVAHIEATDPGKGLNGLGDAVAGALATHFDDFFGGLDVISQVPALPAYREYRAGLEVFESDYPQALRHIDRALAAAPGFVPAQAVLLFAHWNQQEETRADALVAQWDNAWDRLSPAERLLVEFMKHLHADRPAEALRALRALEPLAPRSLLVQFNLAQQFRETNRPRAAVEAHARLAFDERQLRHSIGTYRHVELCVALHMLGEYEQELQAARRAQEHQPDSLQFARAAVRALAALGRVDEAVREADGSRSMMATSHHTPGDVMEEAALELRAHGHRSLSIEVARRAVEWHRARPADVVRTVAHRSALAQALYLAERWDEARELYAELARESPDEVWFASRAGAIAARQGDHATARTVLAELRQHRPSDAAGTPMLAAAGIAALLNERAEAVDCLREAFARGLHHGVHIHRNVDLEPLRDYPPFVDLVRPKG